MILRGHFLHVGFVWHAVPKTTELKPLFDQANEWMRYAPNCWILWTSLSANEWYNKIAPHMTTDDRVLISEINLVDKQGWQDKWVWDWLNKPRTPPPYGQ